MEGFDLTRRDKQRDVWGISSTRKEEPPKTQDQTTYVLVHGAWHGSWCWKRVRKSLRDAAHQVFTPTLTGLGERSHLNSAAVNLSTHIADVVNLLRWEDLSDVILCGHSLRWQRNQWRR
jgi:pimeloyl-ACP methyl ester carboxylesterase